MEKYEKHELTRYQDAILGAFGHTLDELGHPTDRVHLDMLDVPPSQRLELERAAKQLVLKGLLYIDYDEYENEMYNLTPKGKRLWKTRAKEEEEALNDLHKRAISKTVHTTPTDSRRPGLRHRRNLG